MLPSERSQQIKMLLQEAYELKLALEQRLLYSENPKECGTLKLNLKGLDKHIKELENEHKELEDKYGEQSPPVGEPENNLSTEKDHLHTNIESISNLSMGDSVLSASLTEAEKLPFPLEIPDQKPRGFILSSTLITLFVLSIILITLYFFFIARHERSTTYFMIDASENMNFSFKELAPYIKLNTLAINDNVEVGLAVFGGSLNGETGCNDITALVEPSSKQKSIPQISEAVDQLVKLTPKKSFGSIQKAAIFAITKLAGREGIQEIVIITSKLDTKCERLDRTALDKFALEKGVTYKLRVATIGGTSESDQNTLVEYTQGEYVNLPKIDQLPDFMYKSINNLNPIYGTYKY